MNLIPFGQRGESTVRRQDADLSAWTARQVAAVRLIFVLSIHVPMPYPAVLIQCHELTVRCEGAVADDNAVPRENRRVVIQQMLVIAPFKAP